MSSVLLLDLDHTLVHTLSRPVEESRCERFAFSLDGRQMHVHVRPHAPELLRTLSELREQGRVLYGVWTAGTAEYAKAVVDGLMRMSGTGSHVDLDALLSRREAVRLPAGGFVKQLEVARRLLHTPRVWLLDDDPVHARSSGNRGFVLDAPRFDADASDDDLFLDSFARLVLPRLMR